PGVCVRDLLTGRVATLGARIVVNATGPWVDELRAAAGVSERGPQILRRTKGIHCLLPRLTDRAIYHSTRDDRMIFVIPWREFSLIGATDTDFNGDLDRLHATGDEVAYLLGEVRKVLPDSRVALDEVVYTYAGVRPLSYEKGKRESDVSRAHKVVAEERGRFLSITGTKLTCFRSLAEELGDQAMHTLARRGESRSERIALDGTDGEAPRTEAHAWLDVAGEAAATGLGRDTLETLVSTYGRGWTRVLDLAGKVAGVGPRRPRRASTLSPRRHRAVACVCYSAAHLARMIPRTKSVMEALMKRSTVSVLVAVVLLAALPATSLAATEIQFWHAMTSVLGERVGEMAATFNASQSE